MQREGGRGEGEGGQSDTKCAKRPTSCQNEVVTATNIHYWIKTEEVVTVVDSLAGYVSI